MDPKSVPLEFGQGSYRDEMLNNADIALRTGCLSHFPNGVAPFGFIARSADVVAKLAAAAENRAITAHNDIVEEEFKKNVMLMLERRDFDISVLVHIIDEMYEIMDATTKELGKMNADFNKEWRWSEEMKTVLVEKDRNDREEKKRREMEKTKRKNQQARANQEQLKRMRETIARLEREQWAMWEQVEGRGPEESRVFVSEELLEENKDNVDWLTVEMEKMFMEEEKVVTTPVRGVRKTTRAKKWRESRLVCYRCHEAGHYARNCVDLHLERALSAYLGGHDSTHCKGCSNCNKCGNMAIDYKFVPNE